MGREITRQVCGLRTGTQESSSSKQQHHKLGQPGPAMVKPNQSKRDEKGATVGPSKANDEEVKVNAEAKKAGGKTSSRSKKRKAEDDPPRKGKSIKLDQEARPCTGLLNFKRACYQLAVIQCLDTVPELVDHLRQSRDKTLKSDVLCGLTEPDLAKIRASQTRKRQGVISKVKGELKKSAALM